MKFDTLYEEYAHFFRIFKKMKTKGKKKGKAKEEIGVVFFMSYDAEWYEKNGRNIVLSYQVATASEEKTTNVIEYMQYDQLGMTTEN